MQPFIGQIFSFAFTFAPAPSSLFMPCDGRTISINQYQALFALIGTTYGGDGVSTFGIPDLRGRTPIHIGQGPGLSNYVLGQKAGNEAVSITAAQMPAHTHTTTQMGICVNSQSSDSTTPVNNYLAVASNQQYVNTAVTDVYEGFSVTALTAQGASSPISVLNPYLTINYCIAYNGVFPTRP